LILSRIYPCPLLVGCVEALDVIDRHTLSLTNSLTFYLPLPLSLPPLPLSTSLPLSLCLSPTLSPSPSLSLSLSPSPPHCHTLSPSFFPSFPPSLFPLPSLSLSLSLSLYPFVTHPTPEYLS
jgi:hypothetical protein